MIANNFDLDDYRYYLIEEWCNVIFVIKKHMGKLPKFENFIKEFDPPSEWMDMVILDMPGSFDGDPFFDILDKMSLDELKKYTHQKVIIK